MTKETTRFLGCMKRVLADVVYLGAQSFKLWSTYLEDGSNEVAAYHRGKYHGYQYVERRLDILLASPVTRKLKTRCAELKAELEVKADRFEGSHNYYSDGIALAYRYSAQELTSILPDGSKGADYVL